MSELDNINMSELDNIKEHVKSLQNQVNILQQNLALLDKIHSIEDNISFLRGQIEILLNNANTTQLILKYVVVPLLTIVGALIGIKLTFP